MSNKKFYVWTMANCIKDIYEEWGIDMMSMYSNIKEDFPNATKAIHQMYSKFKDEKDCYIAELLTFEKPQFVYEAIANLIPAKKELKFDLRTAEQAKEYADLNMCSFGEYVSIERIDLLIAILLFTEEFIFKPITNSNVSLTDTELVVDGEFVTFRVSKNEKETHVSIMVKDVILLQYMILN